MAPVLSGPEVHGGAVGSHYFRENFAQGGIDLSQIVPELVTKAMRRSPPAAATADRSSLLRLTPQGSRSDGLSRCALCGCRRYSSWRFDVRGGDDGVGGNAAAVDRRAGALGELPEHDGAQRGLFGPRP